MQLSPKFYRRRFEEHLAGRHDHRSATPWPASEAELFDVPDDATFVQQVFRFCLKREPDLDGLVFFFELARRDGRQAVIDGIRRSEEGLRWNPAPSPAPAEVPPPEPIRVPESDDTPELADLLDVGDDRAFVTSAYWRTLGRPPDPDGFEHYLGRLWQGDARVMVLQTLTASPEAAGRDRQFTWNGRPWKGPSMRARARMAFGDALRGADRRRRVRLNASVRVLQERMDRLLAELRDRRITTIDHPVLGLPDVNWQAAAPYVVRRMLEQGLMHRFCESVKPGMVVVDVGANIGAYTLIAASLVGQEGRVYSLETTPRSFEILKYTIELNQLSETNCVKLGLVQPGTRLEAVLGEAQRVDLIRIEADGEEPSIWEGMAPFLAGNQPMRIFLTFVPARLQRQGHDPGQFLDRLAESGFVIRRVDSDEGTVVDSSRGQLNGVSSATLTLVRTGA